jgi:pyrophosphatase PpaX
MTAILWDLDDTLLDTLPSRMRSLAHAYETCLGTRTDPLALWRSHRGHTLEELGQRLMGDDYRRFTSVYREHYYGAPRDIRPYEGIREVLAQCLEAGVPMAVVTSKTSWGATEELGQTGILEFFQAVVGHDDTESHKPDPEPIFEALSRMCLDDPAMVAFVGDSPADIFAAHNAGCLSIAATWGTLDEELLRDAAPQHLARHPADVLSLFFAHANGKGGAA